MRTLSKSQLENKYKQTIEDYHCNHYFGFVINAYEMSCMPAKTAEGYIKEMTKECRKEFIQHLAEQIHQISELEIGNYSHYLTYSKLITLTLNNL